MCRQRRVDTFCVTGAKVPSKQTCLRRSPPTVPAFSAAQKQVAPTCVLCSCDSLRHSGSRFVYSTRQWLCRQSVCSHHMSKAFPWQVHSQPEPKRDLQVVLHLDQRRNSSAAADVMACTYVGIHKQYIRVAYSACQTPTSLPRLQSHTLIPGRGEGTEPQARTLMP